MTEEALKFLRVKQEKIDPEIEQKVEVFGKVKDEPIGMNNDDVKDNAGDSSTSATSSASDDEADANADAASNNAGVGEEEQEKEDKKAIEPAKSSNEILTELFKVFNAAPPMELLNDEDLLRKKHKQKKQHKKEKKKKRKKLKDDADGKDMDSGAEEGEVIGKEKKHKHKKKKKHKHKDEKADGEKSKERKGKLKERRAEKVRSRSRDKGRDSLRRTGASELPKTKDAPPPLLIKVEFDKRRREVEDRRTSAREKHKDRSKEKPAAESTPTTNTPLYNGTSRHKRIKTEPADGKCKERVEKDNISEISLSDEETYLKEREGITDAGASTSRRNSCYDSSDRVKRERERDRIHNAFYSGVDRDREREHRSERDRNDYYRTRHQRERTRSRSRSRNRDLGIDKKRLLEIARKNAISMFKRGNLPGCADMSQEVKDKVLLKMRYGGRTVQDLTDFCKKISNGENLSDLSSDEDSDVDKNGNTKAFHHPFQLKDRDPIVMHIRNAMPLVPRKTDDQTKAITLQFPVSSGQQHRMSESWMPVPTKEPLAPLPALPVAIQSTEIFKAAAAAIAAGTTKSLTKNIFEKPVPQEQEQEPAFRPVPPPTLTTTAEVTAMYTQIALPTNIPATTGTTALALNANPANATSAPTALVNSNCMPPPVAPTSQSAQFVPDVPVPSTVPSENIFGVTPVDSQMDVSSIISKRLNAMRRLQDNPTDPEALKMMYNSQREMSSWASSKHIPGQFTGSTGVNVLRPNELNAGPQVWARRDQLTSTLPVTGGMGMQLLQKMGWKPGEGLGREKTGALQPLLLDVKLDKRGLVAKDDNGYNRATGGKRQRANNNNNNNNNNHTSNQQQAAAANIQDKHPVCLLNELASKRKWLPPLYKLINEHGPSHCKEFLFSVSINDQIFTPSHASNTKKEAKMVAARVCLQKMGILPQ